MLALTHHLQGAIDRGLVANRAAVARKLGLARVRLAQLLDLLLLVLDLWGVVLASEAVDNAKRMAEPLLRATMYGEVGRALGSV
jgi:hypothetical protein